MPDRDWRLAGRLLLVLAAAGIAVGAISSVQADGGRPLHLSGRVGGLYPGVLKPMRIIARNRSGQAVRVGRLSARASRGSPGCPAANLVVRNRRKHLLIRPRAKRAIWIRVGLRARAPDACQRSRFRLRLRTFRALPRRAPLNRPQAVGRR